MRGEWMGIFGILISLALATGGYEIVKRVRAPIDGLGPGEIFSVGTLVKAAGEFLLCGGVLLAFVLGGILVAAR